MLIAKNKIVARKDGDFLFISDLKILTIYSLGAKVWSLFLPSLCLTVSLFARESKKRWGVAIKHWLELRGLASSRDAQALMRRVSSDSFMDLLKFGLRASCPVNTRVKLELIKRLARHDIPTENVLAAFHSGDELVSAAAAKVLADRQKNTFGCKLLVFPGNKRHSSSTTSED